MLTISNHGFKRFFEGKVQIHCYLRTGEKSSYRQDQCIFLAMSTLTPSKIDSTLTSILSNYNYLKAVEKSTYRQDQSCSMCLLSYVDISTQQNRVDLNSYII